MRKQGAAAVAWVFLFTLFVAAYNHFNPVSFVGALIFGSLAVFVLIRFGLLALMANYIVSNILQNFLLTTRGTEWYSGICLAGILLIAALAFYGFYTSLGGRPVFGGAVLDE